MPLVVGVEVSRSRVFALVLILAGLVVFGIKIKNEMRNKKMGILKAGYTGVWNTTQPGLQHTLYGHLLLQNGFTSLTAINDRGLVVPSGAKAWTMNKDFTVYTFEINESLKFDDGVSLTAQDFKNSWESALRMDPKSMNSSLLDVMYILEGFENFEKTGSISGIIVRNPKTLELRFKQPFRIALDHLEGVAFAAYRKVGASYLGTGSYNIEEVGENHVHLKPRRGHEDSSEIDVKVVDPQNAIQALLKGEVDVIAYASASSVKSDFDTYKNLAFLPGPDALHKTLEFNSQKGNFFEKTEHRLALQFLVSQYLKSHPDAIGNPLLSRIDQQVYLDLQPGRLSATDVELLVSRGEQFVPELIRHSKEHPVTVISSVDLTYHKILEGVGLTLSKNSRVVPHKEMIEMIYTGKGADIIVASFSIIGTDPDGLYHRLGHQGAIVTPLNFDNEIADLLDKGRSLVLPQEIDEIYSRVSKKLLEKAPFIHLGINKALALYRNDKVKVKSDFINRNSGQLEIFEAIE